MVGSEAVEAKQKGLTMPPLTRSQHLLEPLKKTIKSDLKFILSAFKNGPSFINRPCKFERLIEIPQLEVQIILHYFFFWFTVFGDIKTWVGPVRLYKTDCSGNRY